ncbi:hypothetical protein EDEG_00673 [Edhazardia aedis USNM 41457]|uniref:Kinesin-like protein n=1 Tax=Edhazardia aedis (strain USNM 41457) TaxID=1003232 RepID=J9DVF0_EDHAE|nr:hypothetical protein EDEG_00673 [Edhazardia aedis USNM 41457]|eukprot:EJW05262.1 hypothetical protein EDEG_00673 [Edhazardia aedis USNM 41457]
MSENQNVFLRLKNFIPHTATQINVGKTYTFDRVFHHNNLSTFNIVSKPFIPSFLTGYNVTLLAYGQTGSGKTYTIQGTQNDFGIVQRTLFEILKSKSKDEIIKMTYIEIYNENIFDLLCGVDSDDFPVQSFDQIDILNGKNSSDNIGMQFIFDEKSTKLSNTNNLNNLWNNELINANTSSVSNAFQDLSDVGMKDYEINNISQTSSNLIACSTNENFVSEQNNKNSKNMSEKTLQKLENNENQVNRNQNTINKNTISNTIENIENKKGLFANKSKCGKNSKNFYIESSRLDLTEDNTFNENLNYSKSDFINLTANNQNGTATNNNFNDVSNVVIREDPESGVYLENITKITLTDFEKALDIFTKANQKRQSAETARNIMSSRSHAILTIYIENNGVIKKNAKFNIVDLAGSERTDGISNDRIRETGNINKSLLSLSTVIEKLSKNCMHINYRDSKLTFLLRDCLGGNSKLIIVGNIDYLPLESSINSSKNDKNFSIYNTNISCNNSSLKNTSLKSEDQNFLCNEDIKLDDNFILPEKKIDCEQLILESNSKISLLDLKDDFEPTNTKNDSIFKCSNSKKIKHSDLSELERNIKNNLDKNTNTSQIDEKNNSPKNKDSPEYSKNKRFCSGNKNNINIISKGKNFYETLNTLNFLSKARVIKNNPTINTEINGNLEDLKKELKDIYQKYQNLKLLKIESASNKIVQYKPNKKIKLRVIKACDMLADVTSQMEKIMLLTLDIVKNNEVEKNESLEKINDMFNKLVKVRNSEILHIKNRIDKK